MTPEEANRIMGDRAVAALRPLLVGVGEQELRKAAMEILSTANGFATLLKQRHSAYDLPALRYLLRMLEKAGGPVAQHSITVADALFAISDIDDA